MDKKEYIHLLSKRIERYFDIELNKKLFNFNLDMFAFHHSRNVRTFLTKNDVIDSYENKEYIFVKYYFNLDNSSLNEFISFLKIAEGEFVNPSQNHMSTYINGIILCDEIDEDIKGKVKKFRCSKSFLFGIKGWFDTRFIVINLKGKEILHNKEGKRVKKVYQITP